MGIMDGGVPGDWISPLIGFLGDLMNGPGYTLAFPPCSMTPKEIKRLLNQNGIKAWAVEILDGQGCVTVRKQEAARACQLLEANGIPVNNPPQQSQPRKARGAAGSPFGVFEIFD